MHRLLAPEEVGRIAAKRALAQLGAARCQRGRYPWSSANDGSAAPRGPAALRDGWCAVPRRRSSQGAPALAAPLVTIVDDRWNRVAVAATPLTAKAWPTAARSSGTASSRRSCSIATLPAGWAAALGAAARGVESLPRRCSNLIPAGQHAAGRIGAVKDSFFGGGYGAGFNPSTGDFSRGAAGFWIRTEAGLSRVGGQHLRAVGRHARPLDAVGDDLMVREWPPRPCANDGLRL
jgi:PmbA protein